MGLWMHTSAWPCCPISSAAEKLLAYAEGNRTGMVSPFLEVLPWHCRDLFPLAYSSTPDLLEVATARFCATCQCASQAHVNLPASICQTPTPCVSCVPMARQLVSALNCCPSSRLAVL